MDTDNPTEFSEFVSQVACLFSDGAELLRRGSADNFLPTGGSPGYAEGSFSFSVGSQEVPHAEVAKSVIRLGLGSAELMDALSQLFQRPSVLTLGHYPLIRSLLEHTSLACWILEPGFGREGDSDRTVDRSLPVDLEPEQYAEIRVARLYQAKVEEAKERKKIAADADLPDKGEYSQKCDELENDLKQFKEASEDLSDYKKQQWQRTDIPRKILEEIYKREGLGHISRILASGSHPGVQFLEGLMPKGTSSKPIFGFELRNEMVQTLASYCLDLFRHMCQLLFGYMGWDKSDLGKWEERRHLLSPSPE